MKNITAPTILVIVGVSGDLARRKLLPAIEKIAAAGILPSRFRVVGVTRRALAAQEIAAPELPFVRANLDVFQMNLASLDDYKRLDAHLTSIEAGFGEPCQRLFYLSVPPGGSHDIIEMLGKSGMSARRGAKLLTEKPFGTDLDSAQKLIAGTETHFKEEQVYRIDHYLAKEMAQNLVVFRSGNSLFKRTWNRDFIESIDIVASETIGIEGRAAFYEQTGALRDIIQSHLLQLAALTLMELPPLGEWSAIPERRLRALESLMPPDDVAAKVVRGQYRGYRDEVANPASAAETFVSMEFFSRDPRWEGVPIRLATGKKMDRKATEVRVNYRRDSACEANTLALRIQPNEGVEFCLWTKNPGYERELNQLPLDFSYRNHFAEDLPEAYERVFVDAMRSDRALFASGGEVLASWRLLQPVIEHWSQRNDDIVMYEPGSDAILIMQAAESGAPAKVISPSS